MSIEQARLAQHDLLALLKEHGAKSAGVGLTQHDGVWAVKLNLIDDPGFEIPTSLHDVPIEVEKVRPPQPR